MVHTGGGYGGQGGYCDGFSGQGRRCDYEVATFKAVGCMWRTDGHVFVVNKEGGLVLVVAMEDVWRIWCMWGVLWRIWCM